MNLPSERPSPPVSPETRPLWIIAISFAAIALCLILITIRIQLNRSKVAAANETALGPSEASSRKPDRLPVDRRAFERPKPEIAAFEPLPPTPTESAPLTNIERMLPETIPAYGGFAADVRSLPGTNSSENIVGRVTLRGSPPVEAAIEGGARPPCLNLSSNSPVNPIFKVGNDGGLSEVIVAVTAGIESGRFARPVTNHTWTFTNCQVQPFISVIHTGQRVSFVGDKNSPHLIQLSGTRARNFLQVKPGRPSSFLLPQSTNELVRLKCLQHPWETAYFAKCDHPFFASTDTNGNFAIPRVPAGTYTLQAMHRGLMATNEITQVITVRDGETAVVNFLIDAPSVKMSTPNLSAQR